MNTRSTDLHQAGPTLWLDAGIAPLDFQLPKGLEAGEPPEARGLRRDQVRLLVSYFPGPCLLHTQFQSLPDYLCPGDVLVVNTSGTLNAALHTIRADGTPLELHLSTHLPGDLWVVEVRQVTQDGTLPFYFAQAGERLPLPEGGQVTLLLPYRPDQRGHDNSQARIRLWIGILEVPTPLAEYLDRCGFPIRYKYVRQEWPLSYYQTVYTTERGSAEMPSAGRAFTPELVTRLVANGIQIAPLLLHTGVASLEEHEPPYEEYYRVPAGTAQLVNQARSTHHRVIAVGTTSVRALETVADAQGVVHPGEGLTDLVITPERGLRTVNGLLTGFHEPKSSHLAMLVALAGFEHLKRAYQEALHGGYLWHEFGDLHLLLPESM